MKILHVIPDSAIEPKQRFLGTTKDFAGRREYFAERGIAWERLVVKDRSDANLLPMLAEYSFEGITDVVFELALYPNSMKYLRRHHPRLRQHVRSINAELLHQFHFVKSAMADHQYAYAYRSLKSALVRLRQDWLSSRYCDTLLSISEWESDNYWRFLAGQKKTISVPYFVPAEYHEAEAPLSQVTKERICVCLLSMNMNPHLTDAARNFHRALRALGSDLPEWRFLVTGGNPPEPKPALPRLEATGLLDSPFQLLTKSKVMALLSDYGYGFKTKILDALMLGCHVLVTPGLFERLPESIAPFCVSVNPKEPNCLREALLRCETLPSPLLANTALKAQAFAGLDHAFSKNF